MDDVEIDQIKDLWRDDDNMLSVTVYLAGKVTMDILFEQIAHEERMIFDFIEWVKNHFFF